MLETKFNRWLKIKAKGILTKVKRGKHS